MAPKRRRTELERLLDDQHNARQNTKATRSSPRLTLPSTRSGQIQRPHPSPNKKLSVTPSSVAKPVSDSSDPNPVAADPKPVSTDPAASKPVPSQTFYIEYCTEDTKFLTKAKEVQRAIQEAPMDVAVAVVLKPATTKSRAGCFEIRTGIKGGQSFVTHKKLKSPYNELDAIDVDEVVTSISKYVTSGKKKVEVEDTDKAKAKGKAKAKN